LSICSLPVCHRYQLFGMEGVLTRVTTVPERNYLPTPPEVARFGPQAPGKADFNRHTVAGTGQVIMPEQSTTGLFP